MICYHLWSAGALLRANSLAAPARSGNDETNPNARQTLSFERYSPVR
jgi:hypothetical protein